MENRDIYAEIMKESEMRKKAVARLVNVIISRTKKNLPEDSIKNIFEILLNYEVEEGVTIFYANSKPQGKKKIGSVDIGKEYLDLWWGKNRAAGRATYALGIGYTNKRLGDVAYFTREDVYKDYPEFRDIFSSMDSHVVFNVYSYAKAGRFFKDVENLPGEWLLQIPEGKSFVPNRPIGKKVGENDYYIFQPQNNIRSDRYIKTIEII